MNAARYVSLWRCPEPKEVFLQTGSSTYYKVILPALGACYKPDLNASWSRAGVKASTLGSY
jgi:hypothetical protein